MVPWQELLSLIEPHYPTVSEVLTRSGRSVDRVSGRKLLFLSRRSSATRLGRVLASVLKGISMDSNSILKMWKSSESQAALTEVAGTPIVDENLLRLVSGGWQGFVCTISGECNGGTSCWPSSDQLR